MMHIMDSLMLNARERGIAKVGSLGLSGWDAVPPGVAQHTFAGK